MAAKKSSGQQYYDAKDTLVHFLQNVILYVYLSTISLLNFTQEVAMYDCNGFTSSSSGRHYE